MDEVRTVKQMSMSEISTLIKAHQNGFIKISPQGLDDMIEMVDRYRYKLDRRQGYAHLLAIKLHNML